jgi:glycosyltransferase involved in cell wall biosynthesis
MYNVAAYVERCIRSLEDQDIQKDDYEIICINDGSPDNCMEIVEGLQKEYSNLILINQKNQGVSRARNNGIDRAGGKYLLFIDPDDYVDPKSFGRILGNADNNSAQVSFLGFTFIFKDGAVHKHVFNTDLTSQIYSGVDAYFLARGDGKTDPDRIWAVLFEREYLNTNNFRFLPDVPYLEDGELIARILCLAERCIFDGNSFYQRTTRSGSATNSKLFNTEKATYGFLLAANNLNKFKKGQVLNERQKEFLNQPILKFVLLAVNSSFGRVRNKKLKTTINTLRELGLRRINIRGCFRTYRFYGKTYNISPYFGALALFLYPRVDRIYHLLLKR